MTATDAVPAGATVKPRLTGGQRVTAALAGIIGYLLISIGWTLVVGAIAFGSLVNLLTTSARNNAIDDSSRAAARAVGNALDVGFAPLVVGGIVGAVLLVLGLFASRGILRRGGHYRPWGVTWAGLGVAVILSIVVNAIGGAILGGITQVQIGQASRSVSDGSQSALADALAPLATTAAISGVVGLVLIVVIGWIAWSWMAHALRPTVERIAARDERARTRLENDQKRLDAESERHARERAEHDERVRASGVGDGAVADAAEARAADARADEVRAEQSRADQARAEQARAENAGAAEPVSRPDTVVEPSGTTITSGTTPPDHGTPAHRAPGEPDETRR